MFFFRGLKPQPRYLNHRGLVPWISSDPSCVTAQGILLAFCSLCCFRDDRNQRATRGYRIHTGYFQEMHTPLELKMSNLAGTVRRLTSKIHVALKKRNYRYGNDIEVGMYFSRPGVEPD